MNIEYVARQYELDDTIREYTEGKLAKVLKFLEEPIEVRVTLETRKHQQIADVHIAHRFGTLQATEENESMQDAVNLVVDKVEKQARRSRKKFLDLRRRADRVVQEDYRWPPNILEAPTSAQAQGSPKVLKATHLSIVPMSLDAAFRRLEKSQNDFLVFRNPEDDQINILYQRRDGNFGLLVPEA